MTSETETSSQELGTEIDDFFKPEGKLSRTLPQYEYREQQLQIARSVAAAAEAGEILFIEAGTGIGKSLSYLVPLILRAVQESKKLFIATGTKTLQHQLIDKELPFLKKRLGLDFSYALCLGAENYLCERRLADCASSQNQDLFGSAGEIGSLKDWASRCRAGLRSELDFPVSAQAWYHVCRIPELCSRQDCGKGGECFYQSARRRLLRAEVLVGNHHLLLANLRSGWEYLPACQMLVIDEAHAFEAVATDSLGIEFSDRALRRVWEGLRGRDGEGCLIGSLHELRLDTRQELLHQIREVELRFQETFHWFHDKVLSGEPRIVVEPETAALGLNHFVGPLSALVASLNLVSKRIGEEQKALDCAGYASRLERTLQEAKAVLNLEEEAPWLLWAEELVNRSKALIEAGSATAAFHATPIEPGEILDEKLYPAFETTALVSATLSTAGDFGPIQSKLGARGARVRTETHPSPFNTQENLLVYAPKNLPEPAKFDEYLFAVANEIANLVSAARGGTFVLCTSFKAMDGLHERYLDNISAQSNKRGGARGAGEGPPDAIFKQGEASREKILEQFRKSKKPVLFGAATFWQGVDVPGKALELVVLTRLPFQVPDDPVLEAKIKRCRERGGNPFYEIQVPHAVMLFRQGVGRLLRSHTDRGVVALLDSRITTKSYGKIFLDSLPPCGIVSEMEPVARFFAGHSGSSIA